MQTARSEIDFVITWVDGGDPAWQAQRAAYRPDRGTDDRPERYRDWELLRYWFRGVECFAPWVRRVHFVTWGHLPVWLDTANPRLHVVRHEEYLPPEALPTFSSNPLEINLHRIPGLSEQFVYFNDDVMLLRPVEEKDFFVDGKPRDMLALQPVVANPRNPVMTHILQNEALVISRHFDKKTTMRQHPGKYFHPGYPPKYFIYNLLELAFPLYTGFYTVHGPSPLLKSAYRELWEQEEALLSEVNTHRFRSDGDVCQYVFREWTKQKGEFVPANVHRETCYAFLHDEKQGYLDVIRKKKAKVICVNDTDFNVDFESVKASLIAAFDAILPEKSSFEV